MNFQIIALISFFICAITLILRIAISTSKATYRILRYLPIELEGYANLRTHKYKYLLFIYILVILVPHGYFIYTYNETILWWLILILDALLFIFSIYFQDTYSKNPESLDSIFSLIGEVSLIYLFSFYLSFIAIIFAYWLYSETNFIEYGLFFVSGLCIIASIYNFWNECKIKNKNI